VTIAVLRVNLIGIITRGSAPKKYHMIAPKIFATHIQDSIGRQYLS
jgi:hypothetical protein